MGHLKVDLDVARNVTFRNGFRAGSRSGAKSAVGNRILHRFDFYSSPEPESVE